MLTFMGDRSSYCDGVSRRDFLRVGALAMGGLTLPELLRAEALAGSKATGKSIINIYLGGGPTHMDTFDLKPDAPAEFRGEFKPIATNAAGVDICELMPRLATVGDKFTIVRSITDMSNEHSSVQSDSGWPENSLKPIGGRPGIGAVMSKVLGTSQTSARGTSPTFMDLGNWTRPGYLGPMYAAFRPDGSGRANLRLNREISTARLDDRKSLLDSLDRISREADTHGMMTAIDSYTERAVGIITSGALAKALDTSTESPDVVSRYNSSSNRQENNSVLTARRLDRKDHAFPFAKCGCA